MTSTNEWDWLDIILEDIVDYCLSDRHKHPMKVGEHTFKAQIQQHVEVMITEGQLQMYMRGRSAQSNGTITGGDIL